MTDILSDLEAKAMACPPRVRLLSYLDKDGDVRIADQTSSYGHGATETALWFNEYGTEEEGQFIAALSPSIALKLLKIARAAREVVERWDTPLWKDVEPTGATIGRLRRALAALLDGGIG